MLFDDIIPVVEDKLDELERRVTIIERKLKRMEEEEIREAKYKQQSGRANLTIRLLIYAGFFIALFAMLYYYKLR
jgi:hypothetical protein